MSEWRGPSLHAIDGTCSCVFFFFFFFFFFWVARKLIWMNEWMDGWMDGWMLGKRREVEGGGGGGGWLKRRDREFWF